MVRWRGWNDADVFVTYSKWNNSKSLTQWIFFKNYHFPKKCLYEYKTASVLTSDNVSFEIKFYFFKSLDWI